MIFNLFYHSTALGYFSSLIPTPLSADFPESLPLILPKQTHTTNVVEVITGNENLDNCDAVITRRTDIAIGVRTADCVPILLHAPKIAAIAAIHAGWRGTLGGILDNTVRRLIALGAAPADIHAAFGPSICGNCYEVDRHLANEFAQDGFESCITRIPKAKPHIDLQAVNTQRMIALGIMPENISPSQFCTRHCIDGEFVFPSWRRTPTDDRLITAIHLTNSLN